MARGLALFAILLIVGPRAGGEALDGESLARSVTIHRDAFGTPHIDGPTDVSVIFGFAYAQAEDYFWQVEDNYLLGLGRYAEFHGPIGLNSDLLNRAFEVVPHAKRDFSRFPERTQRAMEAVAAGLNHYLAKHPDVKPRGIKKFEPWHCLAMHRQLTLELTYRYTRLSHSFAPRENATIWTGVGSNAWAVAPSRTASKKAMLVINPHQPWFGFGQFYEGHLRSGEGWQFSGGAFFGIGLPIIGFNEYAGWAATTNEPDIADAWRLTFDDPAHPLRYRYADGYREATEWTDTIVVKGAGAQTRRFRKSHHGPIVAQEDATHYLAARIARFEEADLTSQALDLVRVKRLSDFKQAVGKLNFQYMNLIYADREGNIYYLYGGIVPRRDPRFDWSKPVDGSDPATEWKGYHPIEELPQVLNPPSGYVQNCNSSPFTTTDEGNPSRNDFPAYMCEDKDDDKRRAKRARMILREMKDVTYDGMRQAVFDNTVYWAISDLPAYPALLERVRSSNPKLASSAEPYLKHLIEWDRKLAVDSTAATLCIAWYEEMYGFGYPNETLKPALVQDPSLRLKALVSAAEKLQGIYGDWKVKWGEYHRIQRQPNVADFILIPFNDRQPSFSSVGGPSPPGILFTQIYTPPINLPFKKQLKQYGVVGATYVGVIEFGEKPRASTLLQFGSSGDPKSPHYQDQAKLLSERRLKPALFEWDEIRSVAKRTYHPGDETAARVALSQP